MYTMIRILVLSIALFCNIIAGENNVNISVDVSKSKGDMLPLWAYFGYDEPNSTYTPNGKKLLHEISLLSPVPVFIRTHNLLTTKEGEPDLKWGFTNAYTEDKNGNPVYDWTILDKIMDTYIANNMKPLVEIGFMPKALSTHPEPYEHSWSKKGALWTGWTYPPTDYHKWAELVYQWVKHSVDRYGSEEVNSWLWEVWNEPDIGYWSGTFEEFCMLYDFAADAVKRACPDCIVGGPHTTNPENEKAYNYLVDFIKHCLNEKNYATGKKGSPLEYIAFHAKGAPELIDNHIQMNMGTQLESVARGIEAVKSFPELKEIPIIIGEFDPEGCAACSEKREPKYGYRNGTVYPSYMASSISKVYELKDLYKVNLIGALSWAFEFENQEPFAGFRDLATNGIDKPVLNVFRMFGIMRGQRLEVSSDGGLNVKQVIENSVRDQADINALASRSKTSVAVMVWNYHDDDVPAADAIINLRLTNLTYKKLLLQHYRVDKNHSNSFEKWKEVGRPEDISNQQFSTLEQAGQLQLLNSPQWINVEDEEVSISFKLPRQGVSLLYFTW